MKTKTKTVRRRIEHMEKGRPIRVYVDGSGVNASGEGSGFAFLIEGQNKKHVESRKGLTNNQAEYTAILQALKTVPSGREVELFSDSELAVNQLKGRYKIRNQELREYSQKIWKVIHDHKLEVKFSWIPRSQNKAGKSL